MTFFTFFALAAASVLAQSSDQRPVFKSDVREVSVVFRVVDKNNQAVSGITRDDIKIDDNGTPRAITSFLGGVAHAQVVVLADVSGSMSTVLEPLAGALFNFADIVSKDFEHEPGDVLLSLVPFSNTATMLVDRTPNPAEFKQAVRLLRPGGSTALVDSVMAAIETAFGPKEISAARKANSGSGQSGEGYNGPLRLEQPPKTVQGGATRSRFLVIFTDAGENASSHRWSDIASAMLGKDVAIYSVIFESGSPDSDFSTLSKITLQSGGKMFHSKVEGLQRVYADIAKEIRSHYQLTFSAADIVNPRIWRNLQLTTNRTGVTIFARAGYCPEAPCQKPDGSFVGGKPKNWNEVLEISRDPGLIVSLKQHLRDLKFDYTAETERAVSDLGKNPFLVEKVWSVDRKRGKNGPGFVTHKAENGTRQVSIDAEVCGLAIDPKTGSLPVQRSDVPALVVVDPEIRIARRPGAPQSSGGPDEAYFQSQAIFYLADSSGRNPTKIRVQCNRPNFLISEDLVQFSAQAVEHALNTKFQNHP